MRKGEDFPYFEQSGFPEEFAEKENYLCSHDAKGKLILDVQGKPYLKCMCGNILSGRTDPHQPFFTEFGSFWTNSTTDLFASTTEKDRRMLSRNHCNSVGYESVALIPLRSGSEIIGLVQLNAHRRNLLTYGLVRFFEELGPVIGIALKRKQAEKALRYSFSLLSATFDSTSEGILVVDRNGKVGDYNKRFLKMWNIPESLAAMGEDKKLLEYVCNQLKEPEVFLAGIKKLYAQPGAKSFDLVEFKDGRVFERYSSPQTITGESIGRVWGFCDITERKRDEEELKKSREQLRVLARHLITVKEEERIRLAREIHDELGQVLTAIKIDVRLLRDEIPAKQKKNILLLKSTKQLIDRAVASGKRICNELRPAVLEELGLLLAIKWLAGEFEKRSGVKRRITLELKAGEIDKELSTAIFRITQEALTNIVRHAKADKIGITLEEKDNTLTLVIEDNGIGITRKQISNNYSLGLMGIKERVESFGGVFIIQGKRRKGTTLTVNIPHPPPPEKKPQET